MNRAGQMICVAVALFAAGRPGAVARAELGVPIGATHHLNSNGSADSSSDHYTRLATDGQGNWVAVWRSEGPAATPSADGDIYFARSIDNGDNWANPSPLNANAANDTGDDFDPDIATDRLGHWVVVWHSSDTLGNTIGTDTDILVARSSDNGATWTNSAPLNSYAAVDASTDVSPRIASDGNGHWVVVWNSNDPLGNTIGSDLDILVARSVDNGTNWSNAKPLNSNAATDSGGDQYPAVAMDSQGRCVAVWQSDDTLGNTIGADSDILVARSLDGGENWSTPIPLNTNAATDTASDGWASIALDDDGNAVAAWDSTGVPRVSPVHVLTATSANLGASWTAPVAPTPDAANDMHIESRACVATDKLGRWVLVYASDGYLLLPETDSEVMIVRSADNGAHWSIPSPFNSNAATDAGRDDRPSLATDRAGNWVVAWESDNTLIDVAVGDSDIHNARFALPDCNNNLIADSSETLLGLLPDINGNDVPDVCEVIEGSPPGQSGCGGGACGVGGASFAPVTLLALRCGRRRKSCRPSV